MSKKEILITAIGTMIGAISGYLYYRFVGCSSGTCRITSKPLNCTLYFALIGGLLFNMLVKGNKTKKWSRLNFNKTIIINLVLHYKYFYIFESSTSN